MNTTLMLASDWVQTMPTKFYANDASASDREGTKIMKRLVSATLALSMLGVTAAAADPYDHGGQGYAGGYNNQGYNGAYGSRDSRDYSRRGGSNDGGAVVAGVGILALAAILASQHHHHYHDGWYGRGGGQYGWNNGDNRGYGNHYDNRYGDNRGYGDHYDNRYGDNYRGYGDNDRRW